jgi:DNA-binding NarL/FixJ family response regulator
VDIELPGMNGIEGVKILKDKMPEVDFIMLTVRQDDDALFGSLCAGATGYLTKDTPPLQLLESIKEVRSGGAPMSARVARKVIDSFNVPKLKSPLSPRETEVLNLLCDGMNNRTIADKLFISSNTVQTHIKNIYRKLHVTYRASAVKKAINERLV